MLTLINEKVIQNRIVSHFKTNYMVIEQCVDDPTGFSDIKFCKTHPKFGIDVVAQKGEEMWIIEAKGETNGGLPATNAVFMSGIGQILSRITRIDERIHYGLAIPNTDYFATSVKKFINSPVLRTLNLYLILVSEEIDFFI